MGSADRIKRRFKLHNLRVLMTVVQAGSMTKAARQLGTSQPPFSRAIGDLVQPRPAEGHRSEPKPLPAARETICIITRSDCRKGS